MDQMIQNQEKVVCNLGDKKRRGILENAPSFYEFILFIPNHIRCRSLK